MVEEEIDLPSHGMYIPPHVPGWHSNEHGLYCSSSCMSQDLERCEHELNLRIARQYVWPVPEEE